MAFTHITALPHQSAQPKTVSKTAESTDLWRIFHALRDVRSQFGLRPAHLQTLQAMISFLKPGQGQTVFASNREICRRAGGVDERTIRRHINRFVEIGLFTRNDSPNKKRYRVRSSHDQCISFGINLTPLFEQAPDILKRAELLHLDRQDCLFLRKQILERLALIDEEEPENSVTDDIRKTLRRKLNLTQYSDLLEHVDQVLKEMSTAVDVAKTTDLTANDGQNDRHLSKSKEVKKEKEETNLSLLNQTCRQVATFTQSIPTSWAEAEIIAKDICPMIGLHPKELKKAVKKIGVIQAVTALYITIQRSDHIRNHLAYFHSITIGRRAKEFNPEAVLTRMARIQDPS